MATVKETREFIQAGIEVNMMAHVLLQGRAEIAQGELVVTDFDGDRVFTLSPHNSLVDVIRRNDDEETYTSWERAINRCYELVIAGDH